MSECVGRSGEHSRLKPDCIATVSIRPKRRKSKRAQRKGWTLILGRSSPSLAVPCSQFTANSFSAAAQITCLAEHPSEEAWNARSEGFQSSFLRQEQSSKIGSPPRQFIAASKSSPSFIPLRAESNPNAIIYGTFHRLKSETDGHRLLKTHTPNPYPALSWRYPANSLSGNTEMDCQFL